MVNSRHFIFMLLCVLCLFFNSCTLNSFMKKKENNQLNPKGVLQKYDFTYGVKDGKYKLKVDKFLIIYDNSISMSEPSVGRKKFLMAKDFLHRLNQMLPDIFEIKPLKQKQTENSQNAQFTGAIRIFGHSNDIFAGTTEKLSEIKNYSKNEFEKQISEFPEPCGESPMGDAIVSAIDDFTNSGQPGNKYVILIISDWKELDSNVEKSADKLFKAFGDKLEVHTIFIGKDLMAENKMNAFANKYKNCFAQYYDQFNTDYKLNQFVENVFLANLQQQDQTSIISFLTKLKQLLAQNGLITDPEDELIMPIHFDIDQYTIKKTYYSDLDLIIESLNEYPNECIEIRGHTDNTHTREYNMLLSEKRAEAVKNYFVQNNILNPQRLSVKGFGFDIPFNPQQGNKTNEDKAKNRRTEIRVVDCNY